MEQNIFGHLLDIENSAASLVFDAQVEADNRIGAAKAEAEKQYKAEYEKMLSDFEDNLKAEKQALDIKQKEEYKKFDEYLSSLNKDYKKFESSLNSYFFGA